MKGINSMGVMEKEEGEPSGTVCIDMFGEISVLSF